MSKRPLFLFVCSLLYLYFPLELGWKLGRGAGFDWVDCVLSVVMPVFLLSGLIHVTRIGWYTLIVLVAMWGIRDLRIYYKNIGGSPAGLFLHVAIYVISLAYFINPRVRRLYFDPKLRWWRTRRRYETHLPMLLSHAGKWHYLLLRNISEGGCFLETTSPMENGAHFYIHIPLPVPMNVSVIKTQAEVRWVSHAGPKPGMGVQFLQPDPRHGKALRHFVRLYV
jgi:hypothetical protein